MSLLQSFMGGSYPSGSTHEINNQTDFDNLVIAPSDVINFNVNVIGSLNIDQPNVRVNGNGNTISGGTIFSPTWTDNGDGTFQAAVSEPKWITQNKAVMKMAETDWIGTTGSTATNKITVSHGDVSGYSNIVGSILIARARNWHFSGYTVTAYDGAGVITLDKDLISSYDSTFGDIKLLGKADYFVSDNEWIYDGANLVIKSAAEPTNIELLNIDDIVVTDSPFITITSLNVDGFYRSGITRNQGDALSLTGCEVTNGRGIAVQAYDIENNFTATNCTIHDCGYGGIYTLISKNPIITDNTIYNIGTLGNVGFNIDDRANYSNNSGIVLASTNDNEVDYSDGGDVSDNTIYNIAYCGIKIRGKNNTVRRNYIHHVMTKLNDGSGIYTFGGNLNANVQDAENNIIENNIVHDSYGNLEGAYSGASLLAMGIYSDDQSYTMKLRSNVVYNCNITGYVKGRAHTIEDNIFDVDDNGLSYLSSTTQDPSTVNDGNIYNRNIIVTRTAAKQPLTYDIKSSDPDYNPYDNGGSSDNNYYINPYGTLVASEITNPNNGDMTFAQLKTNYGQDVNSTEQTNWITAPGTPETDVLLYTNPTDNAVNQLIPAGYMDVDGVDIGGQTKSIAAWYGLLILKI